MVLDSHLSCRTDGSRYAAFGRENRGRSRSYYPYLGRTTSRCVPGSPESSRKEVAMDVRTISSKRVVAVITVLLTLGLALTLLQPRPASAAADDCTMTVQGPFFYA